MRFGAITQNGIPTSLVFFFFALHTKPEVIRHERAQLNVLGMTSSKIVSRNIQYFNPTLTGGGAFPLPIICDSLKMNGDSDMKLGVSTLHQFDIADESCQILSQNFGVMVNLVMSLHASFDQKVAKLPNPPKCAFVNGSAYN